MKKAILSAVFSFLCALCLIEEISVSTSIGSNQISALALNRVSGENSDRENIGYGAVGAAFAGAASGAVNLFPYALALGGPAAGVTVGLFAVVAGG